MGRQRLKYQLHCGKKAKLNDTAQICGQKGLHILSLNQRGLLSLAQQENCRFLKPQQRGEQNACSQSRQVTPSLPFLGFSAAFHPQSLPPTKFPWSSFDLTGYSHWFPGWFNLFSLNYDAEMLQGPLSPPFASPPLCFILPRLVTSFNNILMLLSSTYNKLMALQDLLNEE